MPAEKITLVTCDFACDPALKRRIGELGHALSSSSDGVAIRSHEELCKHAPTAIEDLPSGKILFLGCPVLQTSGYYDRLATAAELRSTDYMVLGAQSDATGLYERDADGDAALRSKVLSAAELLTRTEEIGDELHRINTRVLVYGAGYAGLRVAEELSHGSGDVRIVAADGPELSTGSLHTLVDEPELMQDLRLRLLEQPNVHVVRPSDVVLGEQSEDGVEAVVGGRAGKYGTVVFAPERSEAKSPEAGSLNLSEAYAQIAEERGLRGDLVFLLDRGWLTPPETSKDVLRLALHYADTSYGTVAILAKEIQVAGPHVQELYDACREAGILFVKYDGEPDVVNDFGDFEVSVSDAATGATIAFSKPARFVIPQESSIPDDAVAAAEGLGLRFANDRYSQPLSQWRVPNRTNRTHVLVAGCARKPMDAAQIVDDALSVAEAARERQTMGIEIDQHIPVVDAGQCAFCLTCVRVCPFGAMGADPEEQAVKVTTTLCEGCGVCVGACPAEAIQVRNLSNEALRAGIAALIG